MTRIRTWQVTIASVCLVTAAACSGDDGATPGTDAVPDSATVAPTTPVTAPPTTAPDPSVVAAWQAAVADAPVASCDPLDTTRCYLPYPSDAYTTADARAATGRRVSVESAGLPANVDGITPDVTEWNRNDGFSPSSTLLTHVPRLDPAASNLPSWTDLGASLSADSPVVIVDADTGERIALWAEPDESGQTEDESLLVIHPAISLPEGHRFVVALRSLRGSDGATLEPGPVFWAYREGVPTGIDQLEARREAMEANLAVLASAGIAREDLYLAWDFTVASTDNIAGRMLHIRDDALAALNGAAPTFTVTSVGPSDRDGIALTITGEFTVPNYLTGDGGPGERFHYDVDPATDPDALPTSNGEVHPTFQCNVSNATVSGAEPARLVQYGHGLLGDEGEINAGNVRDFSNEHNIVFCATKWAGMSEDDIANAVATLQEFGNFPTMADRLQQGVLNQIFLGRLMSRPDGFASDAAFRRADGTALIDPTQFAYDGNSQGGIMGLMLAAVSPDFDRAVLGVMGQNYSLLLARSVDFDDYAAVMEPAYPDPLDRRFLISFIQMLWDRGEGAGYLQHVTADPYEGTPVKTVLLHVGFGDWQVSELSAMIAARTMGVPIHRPMTPRSEEVDPGWGLDSIQYPSSGSGLVIWDSGSDPIPLTASPPRTSRDPHEDPRADPDVREQKAAFLFDGQLIDVCSGLYCQADQRD